MTQELKTEEKVIEGAQVKGFFSHPDSVDIFIKNKGNKIKFVVRPMNNDVYANMGEVMKSEGVDLDKLTSLDGLKVFANVYYPAIKVVFPYCCVAPKVIVGVSTDSATLSIADIPMDVCMDLFNELMKISGLSEKEVENRKN